MTAGTDEQVRRARLRRSDRAGSCCARKRRRSPRVVILFVVFTILSPDLFPTKLTYISIMAVAAELGIVSIGVTLLMIGGHFDLSVGAVLGLDLLRRGRADARLRIAADRGGAGRGRRWARRSAPSTALSSCGSASIRSWSRSARC